MRVKLKARQLTMIMTTISMILRAVRKEGKRERHAVQIIEASNEARH